MPFPMYPQFWSCAIALFRGVRVIIDAVLGALVHGLLGLLVTLVVWVALIKEFFKASWGKAAIVGIVAIIVLAIIAIVLEP